VDKELLLLKWNSRKPMSQQEIAILLGCSRGNVSYVERRAMRKIRAAMAKAMQGGGCSNQPAATPR